MRRALIMAAAVFVAMAALVPSLSHCADEQVQPKVNQYEGRISYIDWVNSKIIVTGSGEMEFYVPQGAKMRKLGGTIAFSDLNILDNVIVNYYVDPSGVNIVVRITVTVV